MDMFTATLQLTEASITIRSESMTVLAGLVARLREPGQVFIKPEDNPAAGVGAAPVNTPASLVFGGGAAVPVPPPPPAPSTAVAAAIPIAPAAHISMEAARVGLPPAPPPVLSAPAPPAPVAPTTLAPGVVVDKKGLPWDQRIHAGNKSTNKDGTWRAKRDTPAELVAQVEAELRALMAIPAPPASAAPFVPPPPPPSTASTVPVPAGSGVNPAQPSAPVATFGELMTYLTPLMTPPGKLTMEHMMQILADQGIPGLPQLMQRPDLIATVKAAVDQHVSVLL